MSTFTHDQVHAVVLKAIREQMCLEKEEPIDEAKTLYDLGGDSLDAIEIVMIVEDDLAVEIPDEKTTTVAALVATAEKILTREGRFVS